MTSLFRRFSCLALALLSAAWLAAETVDTPRPGVTVLRNENGYFAAISLQGVVPISNPQVVARKVLNLQALPEGTIAKARYTALRLYIGILDNSITTNGPHTGLTEHFAITINGHRMDFPTSDERFPLTYDPKKKRRHEWMELPFPTEWLQGADQLTVTITKTDKGDDFIYPSFDISAPTQGSSVSFDGGKTFKNTWHECQGNGEFLIRLVCSERQEKSFALWQPEQPLQDQDYAFQEVKNDPKETVIALNRDNINLSRQTVLTVVTDGKLPQASVKSPGGDAAWPLQLEPLPEQEYAFQGIFPLGEQPYELVLNTPDCRLLSVKLDYSLPVEEPEFINLNPKMASPQGQRRSQAVKVTRQKNQVNISAAAFQASFQVAPTLALLSFRPAEVNCDMVKYPGLSKLFRFKPEQEKAFDGTQVEITEVQVQPNGFLASWKQQGFAGIFQVSVQQDELFLDLNVTQAPGKYIVAFPHLDGLSLSSQEQNDYYLFPWGGGIIADRNSLLRAGYGENEALWQFLDLFSPERGGGVYLRIADPEALFKYLNLRKGDQSAMEYVVQPVKRPAKTDPTLFYPTVLESNKGIGLAVDYQRFAGPRQLPSAVLGTHAGNWKASFHRYADWAKKTWKFRPYPSKISDTWNIPGGCGVGSPLWVNGAYHDRYINPERSRIVELNSYWTVAPTAPWNTDFDHLEELGPVAVRQRKQSFGFWIDPATGKMCSAYNRGDYGRSGYNPQWGGLPALRAQLDKIRAAGMLSLFYTDPIIVDPDTMTGKEHGAQWGIINPAWEDPYHCPKNPPEPKGLVYHYYSYCMCLNDADYSEFVADDMANLIKDTGVDGIRLDEYGHPGYICLSKTHNHIFKEEGNVWLRALHHNLQAIRRRTDKFNPDAILMSEFPGNDFLASELDGALIYDVCRYSKKIRPCQVNLFRFFFPECKLYELNEGGPRSNTNLWLFNAVGVYNSGLYPPEMTRVLATWKHVFSGEAEPLVDTLVPGVYANRFQARDGSATAWTLYNSTGKIVRDQVLQVEVPAGWQLQEALTGQTFTEGKVQLSLAPAVTAVIILSRQ